MLSRKTIAVNSAAVGAAYVAYDTRKRTKSELFNLAQDLDNDKFDGWFWRNGVPYSDIAAMWLTESAGNPRATNLTGGDGAQGGSWGLGQVTALTATDYGLPRILAPLMLMPRIGARVSMSHIEFVVTGLRLAGHSGSNTEWVQAYNVGLTGFINGRRNTAHLERFNFNLA